MKEYLRIREPLVILPVDEFTGTVIFRPDFKVCIEGEKRPMQKPDGFFVFIGLKNMRVTVHLSGRGYQEETVEIDRFQLDEKNPMVRILMKPDKGYPFPPGTFYVEGTLPKGAILMLAATKGGTFRKLLSDSGIGDTCVEIYQKQEENLEGKIYYAAKIADALDNRSFSGEWMELKEQKECNNECSNESVNFDENKNIRKNGSIYQLKSPVKGELKKRETRLFPAVCRYAGVMQTPYFIAVRGNQKEECMQIICCLMNEEKKEIFEHTLYRDNTCYFNF